MGCTEVSLAKTVVGRRRVPAVSIGPVARLARCLAAVVFMLAVGLAATSEAALAAPAWLGSQDLSAPGQSASRAQIAFDANGDAVAVWYRLEGSKYVLQASERPAGGAWTAPVRVSDTGHSVDLPQLATDPQGDAVAIWQEYGATPAIRSAARPAGGSWSPAEELSDPGVATASAQVAMGQDGEAIAVWTTGAGVVQARTRSAGGAWAPAEDLSVPEVSGSEPQVAISPTGEAMVVWDGTRKLETVVQVAIRAAGASVWERPMDLFEATDRAAYEPQVAAAPNGDAAAVWSVYNGFSSVVLGRTRAPGASQWTEAFELSRQDEGVVPAATSCKDAFQPQVAGDPSGEMTAVWSCYRAPGDVVQVRTHDTGALSWSNKMDLSTPSGDFYPYAEPQVAVGGNGGAVAVWQQNDGAARFVQARAHPAGADWTATENLTATDPGAAAYRPQVAMDVNGNAVAAWLGSDGADLIARAAGYDDAGPQLRELSIPDTGVAGSPLAFSVSPLDVWSSVASVEWRFGDGEHASGASVSHTFRKPGTYPVQVTATDALGNSTSATGRVIVPWREAHKRRLP